MSSSLEGKTGMIVPKQSRQKQKVVIECLLSEKETAQNISRRLKQVYGDNAIDYNTVMRCVKRINDEQNEPAESDLCDRPRSGRPSSAHSSVNIDQTDALIKENRRIHYYELARRRHRLNGVHSGSDTNRTGAEGLCFYYPRLLYCLNQMLAVVLLSQHRVSSFKTVRPRAPCGARCTGHAVRTWSAVCSEVPRLQFGEGARPHLCMDEWNHPTPIRRRLSLSQATRGKPIPTGLAPVRGTKARSLETFPQYSVFHL